MPWPGLRRELGSSITFGVVALVFGVLFTTPVSAARDSGLALLLRSASSFSAWSRRASTRAFSTRSASSRSARSRSMRAFSEAAKASRSASLASAATLRALRSSAWRSSSFWIRSRRSCSLRARNAASSALRLASAAIAGSGLATITAAFASGRMRGFGATGAVASGVGRLSPRRHTVVVGRAQGALVTSRSAVLRSLRLRLMRPRRRSSVGLVERAVAVMSSPGVVEGSGGCFGRIKLMNPNRKL